MALLHSCAMFYAINIYIITVGGSHDEHTKLGLWVITGMLSFLIIEKMFAKEDEFEHVSELMVTFSYY